MKEGKKNRVLYFNNTKSDRIKFFIVNDSCTPICFYLGLFKGSVDDYSYPLDSLFKIIT